VINYISGGIAGDEAIISQEVSMSYIHVPDSTCHSSHSVTMISKLLTINTMTQWWPQ